MGKDVIIALDFPAGDEAMRFLEGLGDARPYVKVGMELFYAEGAAMLRRLKARGHRIFLDLKLHDIPNTVRSAMRVVAREGVDIVNVHAAGTRAMMAAALQGAAEGITDACLPDLPQVIAVTQLTSTSDEQLRDELLIERPMAQVVTAYAQNAKAAGLAGVVCSPLETETVKETCGREFITVTPGIRFKDGNADDQTRIMDPAGAKLIGSDYIVVGRPITRADDPAAAYARCVTDFVG